MELPVIENREFILGAKKEMTFGIDSSSPIIFDILRNKMYSNKIGAIAREVASNSRDANREAGVTENVEIEFSNNSILSAIGDTSIIFRDYGLGISPDRMEKIFLMYAASTKRDSNVQTGGFGLGAKTPFAYTDSFIVRTVNEGIEYVYNAIIDSTGRGKMILMTEDFTEKRSGTEIIIPITSNDDRFRFEKEVYKATGFWDNITYINFGSQKPNIKYVFEDENFRISNRTDYGSFIGLLDGIPYEIRPSGSNGIPGYTICVNLDFGEVTINANRETLQYDDKTTKYVDEKVKECMDILSKSVSKYLNEGNANYKAAYLKYKKIQYNGYERTPFEELIFRINQNRISGFDTNVYFDNNKVQNIILLNHNIVNVNWNGTNYKYTGTSLNPEAKLVYLDKGGIRLDKNEKLGHSFIMIRPSKEADKKAEVAKEKDYLLSLGFEFQNYSDVKPDKEYVKREKKPTVTIKLRQGLHQWSKLEVQFDKELEAVVGFDNKEILFEPVPSLVRYLSLSHTQFRIVSHEMGFKKIYFINETAYEKYFKPYGYLTLDEVFPKIDLSKYSVYTEYDDIEDTLDRVDDIIKQNFPEILPKNLQKLLSFDKTVPEGLKGIDWRFLKVPKSKFDYKGLIKKYRKMMEQNYPMLLPYLSGVSHEVKEEARIKIIRNYIDKVS